MYSIKWYNLKDPYVQVNIPDMDTTMFLIHNVKKPGWKVVCTVHTFEKTYPLHGFEKNYEEYLKDVERL